MKPSKSNDKLSSNSNENTNFCLFPGQRQYILLQEMNVYKIQKDHKSWKEN